ncbi:hypothetical protein CPB85DRAFT_1435978 [Mucidula mucida]|nr:hypothetical protein CPB85DRAFT_1435978 [Mucidula mucida]
MFHYLCRHFNALALAGLMIPAHLEYFCGSRPPAVAEIDGGDAEHSPARYSSYYDPFYNVDRFFGAVDRAFEHPERLLDGPANHIYATQNGREKIFASTHKDEKEYAIRERRYGRFERTIKVPKGVKDKEIKASLKDGVLSVTFPKAEETRASSRRLKIS